MNNNKKLLLKLENAGYTVNDKSLVKGVSFEVKQGEIVTLIGPNGSGKSTTAKIALGIHKKIDGKVKKFTNKIGNPIGFDILVLNKFQKIKGDVGAKFMVKKLKKNTNFIKVSSNKIFKDFDYKRDFN